MKLVKTASGKETIKLSRVEWERIGSNCGWGNDMLCREAAFDTKWIDSIKNAFSQGKNIVSTILGAPNDMLLSLAIRIQNSAMNRAEEKMKLALGPKAEGVAGKINELYRNGKLKGVNGQEEQIKDGSAPKPTINDLIKLNPEIGELQIEDPKEFQAFVLDGVIDGTLTEVQNASKVTLSEQLPYLMKIVLVRGTKGFVFGFIDNGVMILVGDYIDANLKDFLKITTMGAAAYGNLLSDVFGEGVGAKMVESLVQSGVPYNIASSKLIRKVAAATPVAAIGLGCWAATVIIPIKAYFLGANENIKLVKTASGKPTIRMTRENWQQIGLKAGWKLKG